MISASKLAAITACAALLAAAPAASAQNVALGKPVTATAGVVNSSADPNRITDGVYEAENTYWQSNDMWWQGTAPSVNVYLGGSYTITAFKIQADNNDSYLVEFSNDWGATWASAWELPTQYNGGGMATRTTSLGSEIVANELRFSATGGDELYSISQLEATGTAVVATPEPATLGLLALGFIGLTPALRRRR